MQPLIGRALFPTPSFICLAQPHYASSNAPAPKRAGPCTWRCDFPPARRAISGAEILLDVFLSSQIAHPRRWHLPCLLAYRGDGGAGASRCWCFAMSCVIRGYLCLPHPVFRRVLARLEPRCWPKTTVLCGCLPRARCILVWEGSVSEVLRTCDQNPDASNAPYQCLGCRASLPYSTVPSASLDAPYLSRFELMPTHVSAAGYKYQVVSRRMEVRSGGRSNTGSTSPFTTTIVECWANQTDCQPLYNRLGTT